MSDQETEIAVESLLGLMTKLPLVRLRVGAGEATMRSTQARSIGSWLLEAAEAAEQDASLLEWAQAEGLALRQAATLLQRLRERRARGSHTGTIGEGRNGG